MIQTRQYLGGATKLEACPENTFPEFAFIGRSNVGKSSLINLLTKTKGLAKVSATPGKTRLIHFFLLNEAWSLVDLPGYGYAKVAHREQDAFNELAAAYLATRPNLRKVFALVDCRLTGREIDLQLLQWLMGTGRPFALVLTKVDKLSAKGLAEAREVLRQDWAAIGLHEPEVYAASAESGVGRKEILEAISRDLPTRKPRKKAAVKKAPGKTGLPWLDRMKDKHGLG